MAAITCCKPVSADHFHSYEDVVAYLDGLGLFHMDLKLDRVTSALEGLNARKLPCPVVQIVGTNGKGSTGAFLQSLAMAHGFRAGLYTSPHFVSPTERIRINTRLLPQAAWPQVASQVYAVRPDLTYFEMLTCMAALSFRDTEPDVLVFEAGLGGAYDATSALHTDMVCFTPIDLDHMEVLGRDPVSVAMDKAGALRPGVRAAVTAPQRPEVMDVLLHRAAELNIPLIRPDSWPDAEEALNMTSSTGRTPTLSEIDQLLASTRLGLAGPHQHMNARNALMTWLSLCALQSWQHSRTAIVRGLESAFVPGRYQKLRHLAGYPPIVLDGAHNPHGMTALREAVRAGGERLSAVIFSCLADKQPQELAALVRDMAAGAPVCIPVIQNNPRAMPPRELAALIGPEAREAESLPHALDQALHHGRGTGPVLICGSLYLLGEFFQLFPQALERPNVGNF